MKMIERAARALCKFDGHAENIRFEGAPMWRSYVPQVRALPDRIPAIRQGRQRLRPDRLPRGRRPQGGGHAGRFFSNRKSVVAGTRMPVRVDLVGGRISK